MQLFIDGMLAGVQWPFPVIFTGGVNPALWYPVVGIDAFELREYEIDITPFLPLLCDGQSHTFEMKVVGLDEDWNATARLSKGVESNWVLSGKIFIWRDEDEGAVTTGSIPQLSIEDPTIAVTRHITTNSTGSNETLSYSTSIQRHLSISSSLTTASGTIEVSWTQTLNHTDIGQFLNFGNIQSNIITTAGRDTSLLGDATGFVRSYSYPLFANSSFMDLGNGSNCFIATLSRSKLVNMTGQAVYATGLQPFAALPLTRQVSLKAQGTTYANIQSGNATRFIAPIGNSNASFASGSTSQSVRLGAKSAAGELGMMPDTELYFRGVAAFNGTLRESEERIGGQGVSRTGNLNATSTGNELEGEQVGDMIQRSSLPFSKFGN